ncbi:Uncharacterized protein DBV15_11054 [Temnothorax longispinosus]|uniref:CUB domain-containing protein n=1 Tax=Temnothorax longispinosus TaxID=300112 RepID=A0A4S2KP60_9HYME|nr:Uncharacterized protein DBV15_11054 [Temnothorax longispinosus]
MRPLKPHNSPVCNEPKPGYFNICVAACNKTYYGDVGKTYDLELHRPKEDKVPYICKLTFNAPGDDFGDIVQLTFDSFTLGKFVSFTAEGCPDGSLQISEAQRPDVGGLWCGTSWGPAIYYSETPSVSIILKLFRLSKDQTGFNFDFRMAYKMIRKSDAVVRYGNPFVGITQVVGTPASTERTASAEYANTSMAMPVQMVEQHVPPPTKPSTEQFLGDLISGTYCSRIFTDCDRKKCRLQSPNFPGLYPRNLTCYYAVRQHEVPAGKHALIHVKQPRGQLVAVRARPATQAEAPPRELRLWQDCDVVQDYVTVYDGYTTREPVILKFCGGGEPVPEAISSGPEILVEFTTSPYGTFLHPTPPHSLHGFQLEVQVLQRAGARRAETTISPTFVLSHTKLVNDTPQRIHSHQIESRKHAIARAIRTHPSGTAAVSGGTVGGVTFVDAESPTYAKNKRCEFWLRGTGGGILASPRHSLPRNSTCLYHLRGAGPTLPSPTPPRPLPKFPEQRPGTVWRRPAPRPPQPQFRVWLSILKFHVGTGLSSTDEDCSTTLMKSNVCFSEKERQRYAERMGDPIQPILARPSSNTTLLARYCKDKVPKTCDHAILQNTSRPCSLVESFVSSGSSLTIEMRMVESTALRQVNFYYYILPVNFRALYEFVDLHQDGDPYGSGPCSRIFYSRNRDHYSDRKFQGPRDIFLYGRGGSKNISIDYRTPAPAPLPGRQGVQIRLSTESAGPNWFCSCVYRFEGEHDEVVKLRFNKLLNGNRTCRSVGNSDFNRLLCIDSKNFSVKVLDLPWPNASPIQRDCLCSNRSLPINIKSTSNIAEVHFTVLSMDALDDYNNLFFEGTWDFVKTTPCMQKRRVRGPSGEIKYTPPADDDEIAVSNGSLLNNYLSTLYFNLNVFPRRQKNCENQPWLIDPGPGQYLYVKMDGIIVSNSTKCATKNRIIVHTGGAIHVSVCPKPPADSRHHVVEVFSDGWAVSSNAMILAPGQDPIRTIAIEFIVKEPASYTVTWLELTRRFVIATFPRIKCRRMERPSVTSTAGLQMTRDCEQRCPELDACINASLWCDGVSHCPSGYDEALTHCSVLLQLPPLQLALGALVILTVLGVVCILVWRTCRRRGRRSISQHRLKSISSETAIIDGKEVIC